MCSLVGRRSRTSWWSRRSETTSDFLGSHPNRSRQNLQVKSFPRKSFLSAAALSLNCAYLLPPFLAPHCKALVAGCPMSKESQGLSFMQVREGKSSGERNEKDFSQGLFQKPKKALFWILLVSFVFVFVFVFLWQFLHHTHLRTWMQIRIRKKTFFQKSPHNGSQQVERRLRTGGRRRGRNRGRPLWWLRGRPTHLCAQGAPQYLLDTCPPQLSTNHQMSTHKAGKAVILFSNIAPTLRNSRSNFVLYDSSPVGSMGNTQPSKRVNKDLSVCLLLVFERKSLR